MQFVNLKIKGLYTAPNDFSGVPDGSLDVADDVVIDQESLCESRRGFIAFGTLPSVSDRVNRFSKYQSKQLVHYATNKLAYWNGASYTQLSGTFDPPDSTLAKNRFFEANQNLYLSAAAGVYKLDTVTNAPVLSGLPKGLDLQLALSGSSGFMTTNVAVTTTASTTNASPTLTRLASLAGLSTGMYISGTGITAGTTISSLTPSSTVLTVTDGATTAGSTSVTTATNPGGSTIAAGQFVSGTGIASGTRVSSVSGGGPYTVTLSQSALQTGTSVTLTFSSDNTITMSANATATNTGTSLSFSNGAQVAYRLTWLRTDANSNLIESSPTQFNTVTNNQGTTANVQVTSSIPSGITTSDSYRIYRSAQTATSGITPSDDMQLVYQAQVTNTDISNGYIQVTDITPDSLRGTYLYTSISQQQISQANEPPPFCKDFCLFKGYSFYANVKTKQRLNLTILSVGSPSGVQATDTLVIAGTTYTADTVENTATGHFQVYTSGTPAQNIANTVNSLLKCINRFSSNTSVYGYLLSGPTDLPGQMLIEARTSAVATFYATASAHGTAYSPNLPTSGTTVASAQTTNKNGIIVSKYNQPDHAPAINILYAGTASQEILRVIPLRDYVIVLKQDGIYRISGSTFSTFVVQPFDLTSKLYAPDSAVSLSNEVWGYFDQGVCSVSDTGVNVRSRPIESTLRTLNGTALSTLKQIGFAVGYETDRKYILALPAASGDTTCQQQYVFHTFSNAWTRWTRTCTAGFIDPDEDKLYLGSGIDNSVSNERKSFTYQDFVDEAFSVTISSSSSYTVTLASVSGVNVGDVLYKSATVFSVITAVSVVSNTVTVTDLLTWGTGSAQVLPAITNVVQWKPIVAGNPIFVRQYMEGAAAFKRVGFNQATMSFYSDQDQSFEDTTLTGFALATWGNFVFGGVNWGGVNRPKGLRFLVPQNKQMASQLSPKLTIRNGFSNWALEGVAISYQPASQEIAS